MLGDKTGRPQACFRFDIFVDVMGCRGGSNLVRRVTGGRLQNSILARIGKDHVPLWRLGLSPMTTTNFLSAFLDDQRERIKIGV